MKKTLIALAVAIALVLIVRSCAFTSCIVPYSGEEKSVYAGERIIVNKWSYGLRLPAMQLIGYHRLLESRVESGDIVIFNNPAATGSIDSRPVFIGRCVGVPGDTLMLGENLLQVQSGTKSAQAFVVPGRGMSITVEPWNVKLLCNTVNRHEHRRARLQGEQLYIDGHRVKEVTFTKDYYWVLDSNVVNMADSRLFGFVPQDHVIGRAALIWFSHDPQKSVFTGYRWNRIFTVIDD